MNGNDLAIWSGVFALILGLVFLYQEGGFWFLKDNEDKHQSDDDYSQDKSTKDV